MTDAIHKFIPAVTTHWLQLTAGLMWSGVGVMLLAFASRWLKLVTPLTMLFLILGGAALGAAIYQFGFSRFARRNIRRIQGYGDLRVCLFAFQEWKTYPLVVFMIFLGIYLRVYSPIPKPLLAIAYLGLGFSLFGSSLLYYKQFFQRGAAKAA